MIATPLPRTSEEIQPREVCMRCMRPARVCWCSHVPRIESETRVLFLQHPREERVPIGTARMASLCLPRSELVVGTELDDDPIVRAVLEDPTRRPILLWPGPGARDLAEAPPERPATLVVVDGTWALAKKLVRINPRIAALPRYAFRPSAPSEYRIRREPSESCVSTIEAVVEALGLIEGDAGRFRPMLEPFRAMIDTQIEHETKIRGGRHRKRKPRGRRSPRIPPELTSARSIVVIAGEANAWPFARPPADGVRYPDELVHFLAVRADTGETFDARIAPEYPLAPSTSSHTRLSEDAIRGGMSVARFLAEWRAFVRDDDVVAGWGHYAPGLLLKRGGFLPDGYVDLRAATTRRLRSKPGTIEEFGARLGLDVTPTDRGRGYDRLVIARAALGQLLGSEELSQPAERERALGPA